MSLLEGNGAAGVCDAVDCTEYDFLLTYCSECGGRYCQDHSSRQRHDCKPLSTPCDTEAKDTYVSWTSSALTCQSCGLQHFTVMLCSTCQQAFCLAHRHHAVHAEAPAQPRKEVGVSVQISKRGVKPSQRLLIGRSTQLATNATDAPIRCCFFFVSILTLEDDAPFDVPFDVFLSEPVFAHVHRKKTVGNVLDSLASAIAHPTSTPLSEETTKILGMGDPNFTNSSTRVLLTSAIVTSELQLKYFLLNTIFSDQVDHDSVLLVCSTANPLAGVVKTPPVTPTDETLLAALRDKLRNIAQFLTKKADNREKLPPASDAANAEVSETVQLKQTNGLHNSPLLTFDDSASPFPSILSIPFGATKMRPLGQVQGRCVVVAVFSLIQGRKAQGHCVKISPQWPLGRVLDSCAAAHDIPNTNNSTSDAAQKLSLIDLKNLRCFEKLSLSAEEAGIAENAAILALVQGNRLPATIEKEVNALHGANVAGSLPPGAKVKIQKECTIS